MKGRDGWIEALLLAKRARDHAEVIGNIAAALLDRNIVYSGCDAILPFESHDQAMNHIFGARRIVAERLALIHSDVALIVAELRDSMKAVNDTPRTDAKLGCSITTMTQHARELERELSAALLRIAQEGERE